MDKNVIYIDYLDSYLDICKKRFPKRLKKTIYRILNFLGWIFNDKNRIILSCIQHDRVNQRMFKNMYNILSKRNIKYVVCADILLENERFISRLKNRGYTILDGKYLNKYLVYMEVKKIAYIKNIQMSNLEVSILAKEDREYISGTIKDLARECKIVNVITEFPDSFIETEKELENEGIIINVSTNKEKSIRRSTIAINFDYSTDDLKLFNISDRCILLQVNKEKYERREGITIVFCKLRLPAKYFKEINNHFSEEVVYESFLQYKISYENIKRVFGRDNVKIKCFLGNNGQIPFKEFKKSIK